MIKLPAKFDVYAEAKPGISTVWKGEADGNKLDNCCIPVEFSGPGGGMTAEDLFGLAVLNCIIGEFKFICEKKNLSFKTIKGKASLTVDADPKKLIKFTLIDLFFCVEGSTDIEEVKKLLEYAISNCPVSNSIQIPKTLHITVK